MKPNKILPILLLATLLLPVTSCQEFNAVLQQSAEVAATQGLISKTQADSIVNTSSAVAKSWEDITPSQEYFIGRAVAANVLTQYRPWDNPQINAYLNDLGQTLATQSTRPETYRGYHFMALDTEEINAFAAPGGLILVTRGLIRCCPTEDALAAVLAHEIAHVQFAHGKSAIQKSRLTNVFTTVAGEAAKNVRDQRLAQLTQDFNGAIQDVVVSMVQNGYSRGAEYQADKGAVEILKAIGYNPVALKVMLETMDKRMKPGSTGFGHTHPAPRDRIKNIDSLLSGMPLLTADPAREKRFQAAIMGL